MRRGVVSLIVTATVTAGLLVGVLGGTPRLTTASAFALQQEDPCFDPASGETITCPEDAAPAPPGTVLLQDDFEDPTTPLYGTVSRVPGQHEFAYVDGFLHAQRLAEGGTAVVLLPYTAEHDSATVTVDAQLAGESAGRYLVLGCRRQETETQSGYRLAVAPDTGLFTLVRRDAALEVALAPWQESGAIRRGAEWNRLELTCSGPTIDAIVNGQVVASVLDQTYPRGQAVIGVGVFAGQGAPAEAYFDNLVVTRR
jgi:hypothetical protein